MARPVLTPKNHHELLNHIPRQPWYLTPRSFLFIPQQVSWASPPKSPSRSAHQLDGSTQPILRPTKKIQVHAFRISATLVWICSPDMYGGSQDWLYYLLSLDEIPLRFASAVRSCAYSIPYSRATALRLAPVKRRHFPRFGVCLRTASSILILVTCMQIYRLQEKRSGSRALPPGVEQGLKSCFILPSR